MTETFEPKEGNNWQPNDKVSLAIIPFPIFYEQCTHLKEHATFNSDFPQVL